MKSTTRRLTFNLDARMDLVNVTPQVHLGVQRDLERAGLVHDSLGHGLVVVAHRTVTSLLAEHVTKLVGVDAHGNDLDRHERGNRDHDEGDQKPDSAFSSL